jgi:2-dehydropantoate 2-reductase
MTGVRERFSDPHGTWETSMQRDIEAGNPVEADHVIGFMLDKARKHKLDDTILSLAYTNLKTYEARRAAGRLPQRA